jgi:hypothetical protein
MEATALLSSYQQDSGSRDRCTLLPDDNEKHMTPLEYQAKACELMSMPVLRDAMPT